MRTNIITSTIYILLLSLSVFAQDGAIDEKLLSQFENKLDNLNNSDQLINMVTNNKIKDIALNHDKVIRHNKLYSHSLKSTKISNQKSTGRCWAFAGGNLITPKVMTKLQLSDFQISESYLAFYDKLEKGNIFLERIIELRDRPINDRSLQGVFDYLFGDGGWMHYFISLIEKYGIVPKEIMPETKQSSATGALNRLGKTLLRSFAAELLEMHKNGKNEKALRSRKKEMLSDLYQFLVLNYGKPPKSFTYRYEYKDKEDTTKTEKEIIEREFTPKSFFSEFYGSTLPEYVAIVNNPTMDFNTRYLMNESRNIYEEKDFDVINLPIEELKKYARQSIIDSQAVWFACDVGQENYRTDAIMDVDIYDYNNTLKLDFKMTKKERLMYNDISPSHAMVLTGIDTAQTGETVKWLVENSWGTKAGNDGFWNMYDRWFDEYVLLVIIDKSMLSEKDQKLFESKPKIVEDWQPFFLALRNLE